MCLRGPFAPVTSSPSKEILNDVRLKSKSSSGDLELSGQKKTQKGNMGMDVYEYFYGVEKNIYFMYIL